MITVGIVVHSPKRIDVILPYKYNILYINKQSGATG